MSPFQSYEDIHDVGQVLLLTCKEYTSVGGGPLLGLYFSSRGESFEWSSSLQWVGVSHAGIRSPTVDFNLGKVLFGQGFLCGQPIVVIGRYSWCLTAHNSNEAVAAAHGPGPSGTPVLIHASQGMEDKRKQIVGRDEALCCKAPPGP